MFGIQRFRIASAFLIFCFCLALAISAIGSVAVANITSQPTGISWWQFDFWLENGRHVALRNILLALAGVIALPLAVWRSIVNHKQTNLTEQGQLTDRYTEAVKMLSDENTRTRVGAIYALARIAQDSVSRDHIPVMEVLTEFIRNPPYQDKVEERKEARLRWIQELEKNPGKKIANTLPSRVSCPDIHAALEVIASRNREQRAREVEAEFKLNLRRAQLNDLDLALSKFGDLNLERADFCGANLGRADFTGAYLKRANLSQTNLSHSKLSNSNLNRAMFSYSYVGHSNMEGVYLARSWFEKSFLGKSRLRGANFYKVRLIDTRLIQSDLTGVKNLTQEQLRECTPSYPPDNLPENVVWPFEEKDGDWVLKDDK